jgi:hypothetical protein
VAAEEPQDPGDGVAGGVGVVDDVEGVVGVGEVDQLDGEAAGRGGGEEPPDAAVQPRVILAGPDDQEGRQPRPGSRLSRGP